MLPNEIILFASTFVAVFLLGLQSQFVRDKQKLASFITSIGIGTCQLFMLKLAPNATMFESISFVFGGAFGIVCSIYVHNYLTNQPKL